MRVIERFKVTDVQKLGFLRSVRNSERGVFSTNKDVEKWKITSPKIHHLSQHFRHHFDSKNSRQLLAVECVVNEIKYIILMCTFISDRLPEMSSFESFFCDKMERMFSSFGQNVSFQLLNYSSHIHRKFHHSDVYSSKIERQITPLECEIRSQKFFLIGCATSDIENVSSLYLRHKDLWFEQDIDNITDLKNRIYPKEKVDKPIFISYSNQAKPIESVIPEYTLLDTPLSEQDSSFEIDLLSSKANALSLILDNGYDVTISQYEDPELLSFLRQYQFSERMDIYREQQRLESEFMQKYLA